MKKYIIDFPYSFYYYLLGENYYNYFEDVKIFVDKNKLNTIPTKLLLNSYFYNICDEEQEFNYLKNNLLEKLKSLNLDLNLKTKITENIIQKNKYMLDNCDDFVSILIEENLNSINLYNIKSVKINSFNLEKKIFSKLRSMLVNLKKISLEDSVGCTCCPSALNIDDAQNTFKTFFNVEILKFNGFLDYIPSIEKNSTLKKIIFNKIKRSRGLSGGTGYGGGKKLSEYKYLYNLRGNMINFTQFQNLIELNFTDFHFGFDGRFLKALADNCKNIKILYLESDSWGKHDDPIQTEESIKFLNSLDENDLCINNGLKYFLKNSNIENIKLYGYIWSRLDMNLLKPEDFIDEKPLKIFLIKACYDNNEFDKNTNRIKMKYGYGKQVPINKIPKEKTVLGLSVELSKKIFPFLEEFNISGLPTLGY